VVAGTGAGYQQALLTGSRCLLFRAPPLFSPHDLGRSRAYHPLCRASDLPHVGKLSKTFRAYWYIARLISP
jgi:hypothetical protein